MKISTNWIKDYIKLDGDLKEIANRVTTSGVNVEAVTDNRIDNLVIGNVISVSKHPDSDHLNVCKVNVGEELQIVCGAPNVKSGMNVIVAKEGCVLPGNFKIEKTKIRGVESRGMICALYELGLEEKNDETHSKGIHEVTEDIKPGTDANSYLGLDDVVYTLDLNPNRTDCLSHLGFAYEVAAVENLPITMPNVEVEEIEDDSINNFNLEVDTDNVELYTLKIVKDVEIKESPDFIKRRLISAGMRPINNVVDISNYVMLEYGQPLHFFDLDKLDNNIKVRMAKDKEEIITLDKKKRVLSQDDILITSNDHPVCIAGVMGSLDSEVDYNTKNIIVESAIFNPYNIRYTAINLDLKSEASLRLEKKLNKEHTILASLRSCYLLNKYASGKVVKGMKIYGNQEEETVKVDVTLNHINMLLGMKLTTKDVIESLTKLKFEYKQKGDTFTVLVPPRRKDVEAHPADLIEEIGRLYGYDHIPSILPILETKKGGYTPYLKFKKDISKHLRSLNLNETRTYTLINEADSKLFNDNEKNIKLLKPLSMEKNTIRQTIIPSLLNVVSYNNARNIEDVNIYEISNVYNSDGEITKLAILLSGKYMENTWMNKSIEVDFYLIKGIVVSLLEYLGYSNRYAFKKEIINSMHPTITAGVYIDNKYIGYFGKVHPSITKDNIYVAEFNLTTLYSIKVGKVKYREISKYPSITKDVAFVMRRDVESEYIENVIKKSGTNKLVSIEVFDVYTGDNVNIDL